ncbi:alpha/beta fold hydrolase [Nocardioides sp. B-3]|uniref:alpha/beta fold hydrolase n=1 Tax=Nocardioides sp. B-3 TaxID=2895565 RepID=UPI002152B8C7|nr:alpha/beta hydrolase [Nocardioides sp. B-3]UUZ61471.1 alpha/beta hydrolase [Nocardioides sp. B-3]
MQKNPQLTFVTPLRSIELAVVLILTIGASPAALAAVFYILSPVHLGLAPVVVGGGALLAVGAIGAWLISAHRTGPGRTAHTDDATGRGGSVREVVSADGTRLHVEVDGPEDADVTVVFCHGWYMDLSTWHFQREALNESGVRRVFYDQRGHGLSSWEGLDRGERGVRQLAGDLASVIEAVAPTGRLVLVGHSMGGMTLMAFAQSHLSIIKERVDGVMLVATGAGPLDKQMTLGLPHFLTPAHWIVRRYAVAMIALLGLMPVGMARLLGVGPYLLSANLLAHASDAADDAVAITSATMWRNRLHVAAMALRAVMTHDERDAVPALGVHHGRDDQSRSRPADPHRDPARAGPDDRRCTDGRDPAQRPHGDAGGSREGQHGAPRPRRACAAAGRGRGGRSHNRRRYRVVGLVVATSIPLTDVVTRRLRGWAKVRTGSGHACTS